MVITCHVRHLTPPMHCNAAAMQPQVILCALHLFWGLQNRVSVGSTHWVFESNGGREDWEHVFTGFMVHAFMWHGYLCCSIARHNTWPRNRCSERFEEEKLLLAAAAIMAPWQGPQAHASSSLAVDAWNCSLAYYASWHDDPTGQGQPNPFKPGNDRNGYQSLHVNPNGIQ